MFSALLLLLASTERKFRINQNLDKLACLDQSPIVMVGDKQQTRKEWGKPNPGFYFLQIPYTISAGAHGGPRSRVCARDPPLSPPSTRARASVWGGGQFCLKTCLINFLAISGDYKHFSFFL